MVGLPIEALAKFGSLTSEEKSRLIQVASGRQGFERDKNVFILRQPTGEKSTHNANNGCLGDFDRGRTHMAAILVG